MKSPVKIAMAISKMIVALRKHENNPDAIEKEVMAGCFAAQIVAYDLPIPSGPVDNLRQWYIDNCSTIVNEQLSKINEQVILNLGSTIRNTMAIWELRYNMVHTPGHPATFGATVTALSSIGVNDYIAPEFTRIFSAHTSIKEMREVMYYINEIDK